MGADPLLTPGPSPAPAPAPAPSSVPSPPPVGGYTSPTKCLGYDLAGIAFDDSRFFLNFQPGTGYVTQFTTGNGPSGVYGVRISMAHDNSGFMSIISERPCDIQEAKALGLYTYQYISTNYNVIVSDPALDLYNKAKAKRLDRGYAWLKPYTTYYVISIYTELDATGDLVRLPGDPGYYYRQGHVNDPTRGKNSVPPAILDLLK